MCLSVICRFARKVSCNNFVTQLLCSQDVLTSEKMSCKSPSLFIKEQFDFNDACNSLTKVFKLT